MWLVVPALAALLVIPTLQVRLVISSLAFLQQINTRLTQNHSQPSGHLVPKYGFTCLHSTIFIFNVLVAQQSDCQSTHYLKKIVIFAKK